LVSSEARNLNKNTAARSHRFGDVASIGIGYVSGANDFFHLRPSEAERWNIPSQFLHPSVRNGRAMPSSRVTASVVARWMRKDDPILLLRIPKVKALPRSVQRYLDTDAGKVARQAYKCRVRDPWYSVPDVQVPDFFLSYMSGVEPNLVRNDAHCTCTNSIHIVRLKDPRAKRHLATWGTEFVQLSCEIEGHPLGGGLLKLEPREACQIILPAHDAFKRIETEVISEAINTMRVWRHYGVET
jgi:hypothetical protein